VTFAVGPPAIDRRASVRRSAYGAARALGTDLEGLDAAVREVAAERDDLEREVEAYTAELLDARLSSLPTTEREGVLWRVGSIDGFGPNVVGDAAKSLVCDAADVIAVVGETGSPFVVVASATDVDVDAGAVVDDVTATFGGGGGGGGTFAQGGGLDADPAAVVEALRS
jgi:alanyl-tRNA synthetase